MMGMRNLLLLGLMPCLAVAEPLALQPFGVIKGVVTHITDGDTLRLDNGLTVRLLDINTPELPHEGREGQPLAVEAKNALKTMVLGKSVAVQLGARVYDPYDRVLGHVFLNETSKNRWVNGGMVASGLAHVYTFPDNRVYGPELLALEDKARMAGNGLWALPRWQTRAATTCCAESDVGTFVVVEGMVSQVARVGERTYLNFGPDWRTDFSVAIDKKNEKFFKLKKEKTDKKIKKQPFNFNTYAGKHVRVRGIAVPVNGTMVKVTHPEQLQVLE